MSAWAAALAELAERGPIRRRDAESVDADDRAWRLLDGWGLAFTDGSKGKPGHWRATRLGLMVATNRMEPVPQPRIKGSRGGHERRRFRATWLRALPFPNEIRVNDRSPA